MLPDKISTSEQTTDDDRALNLIHDALAAGQTVTYRGSVEPLWGARVIWLERCEFSDPKEIWRDCCHRQQARVGVRVNDVEEAELRHVAAFHLVTEAVEEVARQHSPLDWFARGKFARCSCGYEPGDNAALNRHWAEWGLAWSDDHGQLRWKRWVAAA